MRITRRRFVRSAVTLGAGLPLGLLPVMARRRASAASAGPDPDHAPAVLYDITMCGGCRLCEVACQANKGLTPDTALLTFRSADPSAAPEGAWAIRRHQCMHCLNPACASACPVAAMYKTPEGPVIYRDERCLGCRYCMTACPFGVPTFDWDRGLLDGALIRKCNFCAERQAEGKPPACVEACPTGAVIFGQRAELLAEAKRRLAEHPDRYVNHIFGEHEAGGTSVLVLSAVPFAELGYPNPGVKPLPELPEKVMKAVLPFALCWMTLLSGVTYLTRLRDRGNGHDDHDGHHSWPATRGDAE